MPDFDLDFEESMSAEDMTFLADLPPVASGPPPRHVLAGAPKPASSADKRRRDASVTGSCPSSKLQRVHAGALAVSGSEYDSGLEGGESTDTESPSSSTHRPVAAKVCSFISDVITEFGDCDGDRELFKLIIHGIAKTRGVFVPDHMKVCLCSGLPYC
jgi:hypothetical protein